MDIFSASWQVRRRIYLIALVILACLVALVWQQFQTSQPSRLVRTRVEVSHVNEPIQPIPLTIALDQDKVALGKQLFEDVRLSKNNQTSCLSCHSYSTGGTDRKLHPAENKEFGLIENSTVFNSGFNFWLTWNGRFEGFVEQLDNLLQVRMQSNWQEVLDKLRSDSEYVVAFERKYPDGLTAANVKDAIATFQRSLYTPNSRFDQYLRGNKQAITAAEQKGYQIFKAYGCVSCHQGVNVGGNMFQRFGVMGDYFADRGKIAPVDLGRFNVTHQEADRYVFRVPGLRNVALTPPYFHDGSAQTLEQAIAIMAKYQLGRTLEKEQINVIAKFLRTLTGEYQGKPL